MSQDLDDDLRETFFQECTDLLEVLDAGLLSLSRGEGDSETVNAVFRATHSIKGGAGAFNLTDLVRFAHCFETALDEVRNDNLEPSAEVLDVFLRCADTLGDLVSANAEGTDGDSNSVNSSVEELTKLVKSEEGDADQKPAEDDNAEFEFAPLTLDFEPNAVSVEDFPEDDAPSENHYLLSFKPHSSLYDRGSETTLLLRALSEIGDVLVTCNAPDELGFENPALSEPALQWRIELTTDQREDAITEIFEFVDGDCDFSIEPVENFQTAVDIVPTDTSLPETSMPDETVADGLPESADTQATDDQRTNATELASPPAANPQKVDKPSVKATPPKKTIRVDLERVDGLINLVGELAINQAMLTEQFANVVSGSNSNAADRFEEFKSLTREIQERVMAIRAQPVRPLFQRMARITREAASATEKTVRLISQGEDTEVDTTIVERLADPLTHMIRNAVDHGVETPEKRIEANKSPDGEILLSASHRSGRVIIKVSDDGAGINRKKVLENAMTRGLIADDAQLSDSEIDNLLFLPGFSTASQVSDLSGRGVGMDVVKRSIQSLGGRTSISSEPGAGTTITISLPLTLAVMDVIVVRIAAQTLVIPLTNVAETLNLREAHLRDFGDGSSFILIRGEPVKIIDVGQILELRAGYLDMKDCVFIVVETSEGDQSAIPVDEIYDQRQVVMKGLEANYGAVPGIAAATILGNGEVALILDLESIIEEASQDKRSASFAIAE